MASSTPGVLGHKVEAAIPNDGPSDHSLLKKLQVGQLDAATLLHVRYANRILALATKQCGADLAARIDPEDIVQSVFRTFFRRAADGHYSVPRGGDLWKLFLVIALNKIRATGAYHRAAKRDVRVTAGGPALEHAIQSSTAPDESALTTLRMVIEEILETLPVSQRRIIELRTEEYEVEEIARRTQRSKRSVERVLQEFRKRLSAAIHEDP